MVVYVDGKTDGDIDKLSQQSEQDEAFVSLGLNLKDRTSMPRILFSTRLTPFSCRLLPQIWDKGLTIKINKNMLKDILLLEEYGLQGV